MNVIINKKGQAVPERVEHISKQDFDRIDGTEVRWLAGGGAMINSRGTIIMIDPVLEGFDMPLACEIPLAIHDVKKIDGYLVTHIDNDHFSRATLNDTKSHTKSWHAPKYVAQEMVKEGVDGIGHDIGETFSIDHIQIKLTPALHNWQNEHQKWQYRKWKKEDYCGFYLETPDGTIWMPGDSKLLDEQLSYKEPNVILLDFSDNEWHITFEGALKLCETYPNAVLIPIHWGSVDAPDWSTFNGNPIALKKAVTNPERLKVLVPGEAYQL
jgi:L-ascorbate metabolism protein UlaG (beta-lactamase superfamily)